jgi:hypothetical protein
VQRSAFDHVKRHTRATPLARPGPPEPFAAQRNLLRATPFAASSAQRILIRRRTTTPETHTLIHNRSCFRPVSTPAQNSIGPVAHNSLGADTLLRKIVEI